VPTAAGALELTAPSLRYVWGTKFEEDFVHGRRALDQRDGLVHGKPRTLKIQALPEEGRPARFTGAVGRFAVRADVSARELDIGQVFKLTLRIEGEGNLTRFATPRPDLPGFHVYGAIDNEGAPRKITYDLAAVESVDELPAIAFSYFEPGAGYLEARTQPIPLTVQGGEAPRSETSSSWAPVWLTIFLAVFAFVFLLRKKTPPSDADAAFEVAARADPAQALTEYLATRLQCPRAAVVSPDLAGRLARTGVRRDVAERAALLVERLVAARYGGVAPKDAVAAATALVDELERAT